MSSLGGLSDLGGLSNIGESGSGGTGMQFVKHFEYQMESGWDRTTEIITMTGGSDHLSDIADNFPIGDTPEVTYLTAGDGEEGPYCIGYRMTRAQGGLCTVRATNIVLKKVVHWSVDFAEISKPIRTWLQDLDSGAPDLSKIAEWEMYRDNGDMASYHSYIDKDGDALTGNTLELAKMIAEKGIDSYTIHAPVATATLTYMDYPEDVGAYLDKWSGTPISVAGYNEGREEIHSKIKDLADAWLCTADRAVQNSDGTYTRTIQWTGMDSVNSNLYDEVSSS